MNNKCETCKYWENKKEYFGISLGKCRKAAFIWDAADWNDELEIKEEYKGTNVFVQDDSDFNAWIFTREDFYCKDFER